MKRASGLLFAGVDGCRGGWVVVTGHGGGESLSACVLPDFAAVLDHCADAATIAIDMPIGLPDVVMPGGRMADRLARRILLPLRGSSVFPCPARAVVRARSYPEALAASRGCSFGGRPIGLSKQCFNLLGKIREIDDLITPEDQERLFESHPEVAFCSLNHGSPMPHPKRKPAGQLERRIALASVGFDTTSLEAAIPRRLVQTDDILDAAVLCWLAARIHAGQADRVPEHPAIDTRGLRMEIWY